MTTTPDKQVNAPSKGQRPGFKARLLEAEQELYAKLLRGGYRMTVRLLRLLPPPAFLGLCRFFGRGVGYFSGKELSFSLTQLAFAFTPEQGAPESPVLSPHKVAREAFAHAAEYLGEVHILDKLLPRAARGEIATFEGSEVVDELLRSKQPCVCLGSHVGPFEFSAACMASRGVPVTVFAQAPKQRGLKPLLAALHHSAGFQVIWRDDQGAAAKILRGIKDGRALCALLDQDTSLENRFVKLFGLKAAHPVLPVKLAIKYNLPIIICSTARSARMRYHIRYERVFYEHFLQTWDQENPPFVADEEQSAIAADSVEAQKAAIELSAKRAEAVIKANADRANRRLEAAIEFVLTTYSQSTERELRAHPEQWFWWHRRWRRRPGVNYDRNPEQLRSSTEYLMWLEHKRALKAQGLPYDDD